MLLALITRAALRTHSATSYQISAQSRNARLSYNDSSICLGPFFRASSQTFGRISELRGPTCTNFVDDMSLTVAAVCGMTAARACLLTPRSDMSAQSISVVGVWTMTPSCFFT